MIHLKYKIEELSALNVLIKIFYIFSLMMTYHWDIQAEYSDKMNKLRIICIKL